MSELLAHFCSLRLTRWSVAAEVVVLYVNWPDPLKYF